MKVEAVASAVRSLLPRQSSAPESTGDQFLDTLAKGFDTQFQADTLVASLVTALPFTLLLTLVFCCIRPHNTVVYAPRAKYADSKHAPPQIGKGLFAWVGPVWKTNEPEIVKTLGLDAALFLRFNRMLRDMFTLLSVLGLAILIPTALIGGQNVPTRSFYTALSPAYIYGGSALWGYVVVAYIFDVVICVFLFFNYRAVLRLRREYMDSPEYLQSLHARTLLLMDIPKDLRSDEGIRRITDEVRGTQAAPRAAIARNVKDLPDLVEEHERAVRQLEQVLATYLKNPERLPATRPVCKASRKDKAYSKGQRVDAIDYWTGRIRELELEIKEVRMAVDKRNAMSYGFASYESITDAHTTAYAARNRAPFDTTIRLAPKPNDLVWKNLKMQRKERNWQNLINNFWVALLTIGWLAPNVLMAVFLSNLSNIAALSPVFRDNLTKHPLSWAFVQAVAAPAITTLFYYYLPAIFRKLCANAGDVTKTSRERHVMSKLYAFFVFNNLIVFSLFSAIFGFVLRVVHSSQTEGFGKAVEGIQWLQGIFHALNAVSPYWASWLLQRNLGTAIDLAQLVSLSWGSFSRRFLSPTPRNLIELSAPQPFDYAGYYNYFLFYSTIAVAFAPLQPLVLPIVTFYFWLDSFVKKYLLLYVFITKHESGGTMWRALFNRMLTLAFLGNLVIALTLASQGEVKWNWPMLAALVPLPILLIGFKVYCSFTFDTPMRFYRSGKSLLDPETVTDGDQKRSKKDRVGVKFGHPVLYKPLITPMVSAKSQHLLKTVYSGRTDLDDNATLAGYSDVYMETLDSNKVGKAAGNAPFEIVNEGDMDFEHFKNRPEFRDAAGGEGQLFGRAPDSDRPNSMMSRFTRTTTSDTLEGHSRNTSDQYYSSANHSRDSSTTKVGEGGFDYQPGYHKTPNALREHSPAGSDGSDGFRRHHRYMSSGDQRSRENLVGSAAMMGHADVPQATPYAPAPGGYGPIGGTPGVTPGVTPGEEVTSYDYFRRGRMR